MSILRDLSDEELVQYSRLADDQMRREDRFAWAQVAVGLIGAATLAWTMFAAVQGGLDRARVAAAGLAGIMLYWPYRKAKARGIWRAHIDAAEAEQARRANGGTA